MANSLSHEIVGKGGVRIKYIDGRVKWIINVRHVPTLTHNIWSSNQARLESKKVSQENKRKLNHLQNLKLRF